MKSSSRYKLVATGKVTWSYLTKRSFAGVSRSFQDLPSIDCNTSSNNLSNIDWQGIYHAQQPVVLRGLALTWPAVSSTSSRRWADFKAVQARLQSSQDSIVPIEVGAHYMDPHLQKHHISLISFLDFLRSYEEGQVADVNTLPKVYLAQHSLQEISSLHQDIVQHPDICKLTGKGSLYDCKLWWSGPRGSVSPCHFDPFHNLLVHVIGEKKVQLIDPKFSEYLYPAHGTVQKNTSLVDFEQVDQHRFPKFAEVEGYETTLQAGDAVYIPLKWWHYCTSKTTSCSVNYWWL